MKKNLLVVVLFGIVGVLFAQEVDSEVEYLDFSTQVESMLTEAKVKYTKGFNSTSGAPYYTVNYNMKDGRTQTAMITYVLDPLSWGNETDMTYFIQIKSAYMNEVMLSQEYIIKALLLTDKENSFVYHNFETYPNDEMTFYISASMAMTNPDWHTLVCYLEATASYADQIEDEVLGGDWY